MSTSTTVRLFAALREAAGREEITSGAGTVAELCAELRARFGDEFTARLAQATIVVDGEATAADSTRSLEDADEVALLPPFSGG